VCFLDSVLPFEILEAVQIKKFDYPVGTAKVLANVARFNEMLPINE
jgi:hypothetical protein